MNDIMVTDFTVKGKCSGCGNCCGGVLPLSKKEVAQIKQYIKEHDIKEQSFHHGQTGVDFTCPFRDEVNKKCLVYEVRPQICRLFMCNHTIEDIRKVKERFNKNNEVVYMRNEFYGNSEALEYMHKLTELLVECVGGKRL